ncbi:NAD(P)/FAD-dependent oxidoreductase [Nocardia sp. NEAU-G5]|uniref:NAD(P)/FAD-dependent oxidoreductase n=1 Tax=Nocardia albiluteola TaxID=2842303 RepID=A0ABS6B7M0_9NOCA|nr:NAD(P)/FAD-dependent oxidoreductase [Nocardia albiluteola]MBU3066302.1 NAD(P)/FAD-dependent oxidoreductase [Nocardia albiluteola]
MKTSPGARDPRIVIIGAGVAGITAAYTFTHAGFTNVTILEKGSDVGGVWHWNRYPGLTCDVPSTLYQFGFAPKPDWSRIWATGGEIQRYHREVVEHFGLDRYLRLNSEVTAAEFDGHQWQVTVADGTVLEADFVIAATGVLHHPAVPDIPGMDDFAGPVVHTARWRDDIATAGKRIAVLGTGSTGVQVVSALQPEASALRHFVRSPQWVLWAPMGIPQPEALTRLLRSAPPLAHRLYGLALEASGVFTDIVLRPSWRRKLVQSYARRSLDALVRDRDLHARLTPEYEPLCKRPVVSGSYYRAITAPNADLVTDAITEITPTAIRTADGREHPVDVIVLATGFRAHEYMRPMDLRGRDGVTIDQAWAQGPRAYRTTAIPGFPNLFTVLGPNSPTGSISLQYAAERTAAYITHWLNRFRDGDIDTVEVTESATDAYYKDVDEAMGPTVWNTGCDSWYFTEGRTIDLWPFDRRRLSAMLAVPDPAHYRITRPRDRDSDRGAVGARSR